ncbi:hypothetical protein PIB30_089363 [Stylosanthes scabra]|uniref:Ubiquitin-like protease family profile domain-containing protein n=1 Tax=Stylosanthes scabra TaxID=79078 RepID=A0ABU6WU14_9FABA|nr:hypothetical protein [Stylosanthes scabra]
MGKKDILNSKLVKSMEMEDTTKEKKTLGKRKHHEEAESEHESENVSSDSESEDESEDISSDSESEPDSEKTISQDDNIGRKQKRTRIAVQRPQNEEDNAALDAAAGNERRSKHRHEVNVEEIQPPPNADVNPAGAEIIANAEAAPLNPLPENPAAAAPIETLPPNDAPAVDQINQLAEKADTAVDPPSQGVAAIDDVLVTPQDYEIEVVEATCAEEKLISRELNESTANLVTETNVEKGAIAEKESVIEQVTHKYWDSNREPKENVEAHKEVHEEVNRNIMMIAQMAVAQGDIGPLPSFDLGIDFGSQSQSQFQPEKEKEPAQETEKHDQDVQKEKGKEIQQHQGPEIKTPEEAIQKRQCMTKLCYKWATKPERNNEYQNLFRFDCGVYVLKYMDIVNLSHLGRKNFNVPVWAEDELQRFREEFVEHILYDGDNYYRHQAIKASSATTRHPKPSTAL